MKFKIIDAHGDTVAGLEEIDQMHSALGHLTYDRAPNALEIGESTAARGLPAGGSGKNAERYWIVRTE